MNSLRRLTGSSILSRLFQEKRNVTNVRFLYNEQFLGIDKYVDARQRTMSRLGSMRGYILSTEESLKQRQLGWELNGLGECQKALRARSGIYGAWVITQCYFEEIAQLGVLNEQEYCFDEKASVQSCLVISHAMPAGNFFACITCNSCIL
ncbi:hypothetical protein TNCT_621631 [Trichonephila clavata]|uniref:Uncharacterized protein n=1 Tax=Trichonephila clavata TaxID=2740835 RepID=A0A8X6IFI7_TRICU|nr:hypothetical protein TNCT_621631 [Trichonephila clavata]